MGEYKVLGLDPIKSKKNIALADLLGALGPCLMLGIPVWVYLGIYDFLAVMILTYGIGFGILTIGSYIQPIIFLFPLVWIAPLAWCHIRVTKSNDFHDRLEVERNAGTS